MSLFNLTLCASSCYWTVQDDLEALQERDPEFYQYLKETDSGLLDFELDDSDEEAPEAPATIKVVTEKSDLRVAGRVVTVIVFTLYSILFRSLKLRRKSRQCLK